MNIFQIAMLNRTKSKSKLFTCSRCNNDIYSIDSTYTDKNGNILCFGCWLDYFDQWRDNKNKKKEEGD